MEEGEVREGRVGVFQHSYQVSLKAPLVDSSMYYY